MVLACLTSEDPCRAACNTGRPRTADGISLRAREPYMSAHLRATSVCRLISALPELRHGRRQVREAMPVLQGKARGRPGADFNRMRSSSFRGGGRGRLSRSATFPTHAFVSARPRAFPYNPRCRWPPVQCASLPRRRFTCVLPSMAVDAAPPESDRRSEAGMANHPALFPGGNRVVNGLCRLLSATLPAARRGDPRLASGDIS